MVSTRSGVRTKPVDESKLNVEKEISSEVPQKKAPSKRAKDAKLIKEEEEEKVDVGALEHDSPVRKSTRVRRPAIKEDFEEPKPSRFSKAARKAELAQAASTPLPEEATTEQEAQEDEEDADAHTKPAKAGNKTHKGHQPTQGDVEDAEPAEGHSQPPADMAHKRKLAQLRGAMSRLPWKWIALALCLAALAGAAYHYRHPLAQRFHQVELQARSQLANSKAHIQGPIYKKARAWEHSLRQGFHQQRENFLDGWFVVQQRVKGYWRSLFKGSHSAVAQVKPCSAQLDGAALEVLLAQDPAWDGLRGSAQDVWAGHKEDQQKGMGVLMVGRTEAAASAAVLALQRALPASCHGCFLAFKAGQAAHASPDAAGAVQKELAGFLKGCPGGVVALDNAQKLHPALLPVFINALSEQGSFEVDGQSIPAYNALYVATMQDSSDTLKQSDEASFKRKAKKSLTSALTERVPALMAPMTTSHAEALRRRLEVVLPLKD